MASAPDQIAAAPKKTRAKAAPKVCGVPDCGMEAAPGARLRLTVLEPASMYPSVTDGKIQTCKAHRRCVGFNGYSTEHAVGSEIHQSCGDAAKIFYLGHAFCESCHNVYLEALVALAKPRLTSEQIDNVRTQVVKEHYKKPDLSDPAVAEMAALTARMAVLSGQSGKGKKAAPKAAPKTAKPKKADPVAIAAAAAASAAAAQSGSEGASMSMSESDTESMEVAPAQPPVVAAAKPPPSKLPDEFEKLAEDEVEPTKEQKAQAVVSGAAPAAVKPKTKKAAAPVVKA